MHQGLVLFHLKGLRYEFVFYEAARCVCPWSFIIPFERITVRIRVLRGGEAHVHGLLLFHLKGLQYEFVFYEAARRGCIYCLVMSFL